VFAYAMLSSLQLSILNYTVILHFVIAAR
jgi:hypothetical protein